jgi:hypothetical protein
MHMYQTKFNSIKHILSITDNYNWNSNYMTVLNQMKLLKQVCAIPNTVN